MYSDSSHGVTFTHSKNLKKATKSDWIWGTRDEGGDSADNKKRLGDAWISKLESGKTYSVKYSGVKKKDTTKTYDVKVKLAEQKDMTLLSLMVS